MADHRHDRRGVDYTCWKCHDPQRIVIENSLKTQSTAPLEEEK